MKDKTGAEGINNFVVEMPCCSLLSTLHTCLTANVVLIAGREVQMVHSERKCRLTLMSSESLPLTAVFRFFFCRGHDLDRHVMLAH